MILLRAACLLFLAVYSLSPVSSRQELESVKLVTLTDSFSPGRSGCGNACIAHPAKTAYCRNEIISTLTRRDCRRKERPYG